MGRGSIISFVSNELRVVPNGENPSEGDAIPERNLAIAVLWRALDDAQGLGAHLIGRVSDFNSVNMRGTIVDHGRAFCLARSGPWAVSREIWCDRAGVDPTAFYERAMRILGPNKNPRISRR